MSISDVEARRLRWLRQYDGLVVTHACCYCGGHTNRQTPKGLYLHEACERPWADRPRHTQTQTATIVCIQCGDEGPPHPTYPQFCRSCGAKEARDEERG